MRRSYRLTLSAVLAAGLAGGATIALVSAGPAAKTPAKPMQLTATVNDQATEARLQKLQRQLTGSTGGSAKVRQEIAKLQAQLAASRARSAAAAAQQQAAGYPSAAPSSTALPRAGSSAVSRPTSPATAAAPSHSRTATRSSSESASPTATSTGGGHDDD